MAKKLPREIKPMSTFRQDVRCLDEVMIVVEAEGELMVGVCGQYNNKFHNSVPYDEIWNEVRCTLIDPIIKTETHSGRKVVGYEILKRNEIPISSHPQRFRPSPCDSYPTQTSST